MPKAILANKLQLAIVVWLDAWGDCHAPLLENEIDSRHEPLEVHTMGWILKDDKVGISLAGEQYLDQGDIVYRNRSFIPRELIKSVTPYSLAKPKKSKIKAEFGVIAPPPTPPADSA